MRAWWREGFGLESKFRGVGRRIRGLNFGMEGLGVWSINPINLKPGVSGCFRWFGVKRVVLRFGACSEARC